MEHRQSLASLPIPHSYPQQQQCSNQPHPVQHPSHYQGNQVLVQQQKDNQPHPVLQQTNPVQQQRNSQSHPLQQQSYNQPHLVQQPTPVLNHPPTQPAHPQAPAPTPPPFPVIGPNNVNSTTPLPSDDKVCGCCDEFNAALPYLQPFRDRKVRQDFVRKIYPVICFQLLLCFEWVLVCLYIEPVNEFLKDRWWLTLVIGGSGLMLFTWVFICGLQQSVSFPLDMLLLIFGTLWSAGFLGSIAIWIELKVVVLTFGTTIFVMLWLILQVFQRHGNYNHFSGNFVWIGLVVAIYIFTGCYLFPKQFDAVIDTESLIGSFFAVVLINGLLVMSTHMLMRKHTEAITPNTSIFAAFLIFMGITFPLMVIVDLFVECCSKDHAEEDVGGKE